MSNNCCWWSSFLQPKLKWGDYFWNTRYQETDGATFKSHSWSSFLCFGKFKNSELKSIAYSLVFSLSYNSCFLNHVSAQCFDLTVQSNQTCWVFQKYHLLHKYLCICGCFSCYMGCFMVLFTSIFWSIYCFTGSSESNRVQKISDKRGYFTL